MAPARRSVVAAALRVGDGVSILAGFLVVALGTGYQHLGAPRLALTLAAATLVGWWALRLQDLWNERVTAMRTVEVAKLARAAAILGAAMLVIGLVSRADVRVEQLAGAVTVSWLFLLGWRSLHRAWLAHNRRAGRFTRGLVIVGTDPRAAELASVVSTHPEAGLRLCGVIGSSVEAASSGLGDWWLGGYADADDVLGASPADVVVVCSTDVSPHVLSALVRGAHRRGRQLFVHPGLSGIDVRRVKPSPLAYEPVLYVDAPTLSGAQRLLKRVIDAVVAIALLVLLSPILALIALAVKAGDGGPVLFRQQRVGRNDRLFGVLKFRTMVVDAEARRAALEHGNQRTGPLFKLDADPRVTRIGRFLRAGSLDELPQLINVVKGEMSLVGPRPALPSEVAAFPTELHRRHRVRPGITGLWQVEARDNPSFDAYQRLDLFYVENWSLALDLVIMLGTAEQLVLRPLFRSRRTKIGDEVEVAVAA